MSDLDRWLDLDPAVRRDAAHEAWCSVGAEQGFCPTCHVGFRGLRPFDQGIRQSVDGCVHPDLIREGSLMVLEWREARGVMCPRAGHPDARRTAA